MVPLQQRLPQSPAQQGGWLGLGGAAAVETLVLPGAGGSLQLWGVCGEKQGRDQRSLSPPQEPRVLPPGVFLLTLQKEGQWGPQLLPPSGSQYPDRVLTGHIELDGPLPDLTTLQGCPTGEVGAVVLGPWCEGEH